MLNHLNKLVEFNTFTKIFHPISYQNNKKELKKFLLSEFDIEAKDSCYFDWNKGKKYLMDLENFIKINDSKNNLLFEMINFLSIRNVEKNKIITVKNFTNNLLEMKEFLEENKLQNKLNLLVPKELDKILKYFENVLKQLDIFIKQYELLKDDYQSKIKQYKILEKIKGDEISKILEENNYIEIEKQLKIFIKESENISDKISDLEKYFKEFKDINLLKNKIDIECKYKNSLYVLLLNNIVTLYKSLKAGGNIRHIQNSLKKKLTIDIVNNLIKPIFPVIIGSLRDYTTIIPLAVGIFDLIIIDESSQVSIAQALPTLIRGKKVLVFGDKEQFSNIKTSMAATEINNKYMDNINNLIKNEDELLKEKLKIFNIKNSVLDFIENNKPDFFTTLKTHFRGYPELISFSNKYFYGGTLQTLKIRKKPIQDIIKFEFIKPNIIGFESTDDGNSNEAEVNFIYEKIEELKMMNSQLSLGIITPFNDQIKLLLNKLEGKNNEFREYCNMVKLKIMTFDSCQGEEKSIVFYSMCATKDRDRLKYIFPQKIDKTEDEDNKKLKLQRLNVGFSRAQECIYFILSKPVNEFSGGIRIALEHFEKELSKEDTLLGKTNKQNPMEEKIKEYIVNTEFYQKNKEKILLKCQFPIGEYLGQIDRRYKHPKYIADFLLSYNNHNMIIEYDSFDYHFDKETDKYNYKFHYKEEDILRQQTLESYGYRFIRLNKFNIDCQNPIDYINRRLADSIK